MKPSTKRERIKALHDINPMGMFAVFCRSQSGTKAYFSSIHDTAASAHAVCQEHAAEQVTRGSTDFTYYVVQIKAKMGIEHGKYVNAVANDFDDWK
jgi:hypothetical protein